MNVTLKLEDDLCKEARHKAVDAGLSLSGWITELLKRELTKPLSDSGTLLELLGDDTGFDIDFPRVLDQPRAADFS